MPSPEELELAGLRAAQERLGHEWARFNDRLEQLAARIAEKHHGAPPLVAASPLPPPLPVEATEPVGKPVPLAPFVGGGSTRGAEPEQHVLPYPPRERSTPELARPARERVEKSASARPAGPVQESLEFHLGTVWLVRMGVVILLTGLVFLGNFAYHTFISQFGAAGKLALLYLAGGALAGIGWWLRRGSQAVQRYATVLLAGGAATAYYATYAAHFVERLRVIESPLVGGLALLAAAGAIIWLADREKSEPLALIAVLLAYYTSAINPLGPFTLFSCLLLTAVAVWFLVRHRWVRVPFASVVGSYGSYAFWRCVGEGHAGAESAWWGLAFLAGVWCIFTVAVFVGEKSAFTAGGRLAFLTANNGAFFAGATHVFAVQTSGKFWMFAVGYGAVLLALSLLARRRDPEDERLDGAYLAQGLAVGTLGLCAKLERQALVNVLAVESVVLVTCSRWRHALIYRIAASVCALLAVSGAPELFNEGATRAAWTGAAVIGVLVVNAWLLKRVDEERFPRIAPWALFFALLALLLLCVQLSQTVAPAWRGEAFALAGVLCAVSLPLLRLPELAVAGQTLLLVSLGLWLHRRMGGTSIPWWQPLPLIAVFFGLSMWWKRVAGSLLEKAKLLAHPPSAVFPSAASEVPPLAPLGRNDGGGNARAVPGAGESTGAVGAAGDRVVMRDEIGHESNRIGATVGRVYRVFGCGLLIAWGFDQIPHAWQLAFFCGLGAAVVLAGGVRRSREAATSGAVFAGAGLAAFGAREGSLLFAQSAVAAPATLDLLAMLLFAVAWRAGRKLAGESAPFPEIARRVIPGAIAASIWLWVTRWSQATDAMPVTVAWSLLALALFAAGLGLRERAYRLAGLTVLALAIGRVILFDVWRFETLGRIVSFLVLGAVLLLLGYLYNRFGEKLREWL